MTTPPRSDGADSDGLITSTRRPAGTDDWPLADERPPPREAQRPWLLMIAIGASCLALGVLAGAWLF